MSSNRMSGKEAGEALRDMLRANSVLKELDVSNNSNKYTHCHRQKDGGIQLAKGMAEGLRANSALVKFDISNNQFYAEGTKAVAHALQGHTSITELNASGIGMIMSIDDSNGRFRNDMSGLMEITRALLTMRALTSVNCLSNHFDAEHAEELIASMASKPNLKTLCGFRDDDTELNLSSKGLSAGCAVLIANEVKNNTVLTSLDISANHVATKEAGKALADALAANTVLKKLNVAHNLDGYSSWTTDGPGFAQELANGIRANRVLTKLDICGNKMATKETGKALSDALAANSILRELNVSNNNWHEGIWMGHRGDGPGFVQELAIGLGINEALTRLDVSSNKMITNETGKALGRALAQNKTLTVLDLSSNMWERRHYYPTCAEGDGFARDIALGLHANETLVSVNLLYNRIGVDQACQLATTLEKHPTLTSLCGNMGDETDLDMSGGSIDLRMKGGDVIMLAPEIVANRSITRLNLSDNDLSDTRAGKALGNMLAANAVLQELDLSGCSMYNAESVHAFVVGLRANKALTSLNIADNWLTEDGAKHVADAIKVHVTMSRLIFGHDPDHDEDDDEYCGSDYSNSSDDSDDDDDASPPWTYPVLEVGMTEARFCNKGLGACDGSGAILVSTWISVFCHTIHTLDVSHNKLCVSGCKALVPALQNNQTLTELNMARNHIGQVQGSDDDWWWGTSGIDQVANVIPTMGSLVTFNLSKNGLCAAGAKILAKALTNNQNMTELNLSSNYLGRTHPSGIRGDADLSGIIAIGDALLTMGSLTRLDVSNNHMVSKTSWLKPPNPNVGIGDEVDGKTVTSIATDGDIELTDTSGVVALMNCIKHSETLTSLNLACNRLHVGGSKCVAEAMKEQVGG